MLGYHINPYVRTVIQRINDDSICKEDECYSQYEEKSPLILRENRAILHSIMEGWKIGLRDDDTLPKSLITTYNLTEIPESKDYLLKEDETHDRIEVAEKFIIELNKILK